LAVNNKTVCVGFGPATGDLQTLALAWNVLEGTIPPLVLLSNLVHLDLSSNSETGGVGAVDGLMQLGTVDLSFNQILMCE
jgi:hypothetical protein